MINELSKNNGTSQCERQHSFLQDVHLKTNIESWVKEIMIYLMNYIKHIPINFDNDFLISFFRIFQN